MNVFIAWNAFSVLEFLAVEKNSKNFYCCIDPYYNKDNFDNIYKFINKCLEKNIFKGILNETNLKNLKINKLYCMSNLNDNLITLLENLNYQELNFLEEGLFDYLKNNFSEKERKLCKKANLYLNNKTNFQESAFYKSINNIYFEEKTLNKFFNLINFNISESFDLIFFTSPIHIDFNTENYSEIIISFLEKNFEGKNILLKKHPRDFLDYKSNKLNIIDIDSNVPGQILNLKYNCEKIYAYPSTVILLENNLDNTSILKYKNLKHDKSYIQSFSHEKMSKCNIIEI